MKVIAVSDANSPMTSTVRRLIRAMTRIEVIRGEADAHWVGALRRNRWYVIEISAEVQRSPAFCQIQFLRRGNEIGGEIICRLESGRVGKVFVWMPYATTEFRLTATDVNGFSIRWIRIGRVARFFARGRVLRKLGAPVGLSSSGRLSKLGDSELFDLYRSTLGLGQRPFDADRGGRDRSAALHLAKVVLAGNYKMPDLITFSHEDTPQASVIIPAHDHIQISLACLEQLARVRAGGCFEVIFVDDGSSDGTLEIEALVKGIRVVRHESPRGFIHACNAGATLATAPVLIFLNNDTLVLDGWLRGLLDAFEWNPNVAVAGAKLIYPDGRLQEAGCYVLRDGAVFNEGRSLDPDHPRFNFSRPVDYVSGACLAVRRSQWRALSGFDALFAPAYFEDADFCFRIRQAGGVVAYAPECEVVHFEGFSSGTDTGVGVKAYQVSNRIKFLDRWKDVLASHADSLEKQKFTHYRRSVLMIDSEYPDSERSGGGYAALREAELLLDMGFRVSLYALSSGVSGDVIARWQRAGVEVFRQPYYPDIETVLKTHGSEFHFVIATRYYVMNSVAELLRHYCPAAKLILNLADLHYLREMRHAQCLDSRDALTAAGVTKEDEIKAMKRSDLVLTYTEVERALILSQCSATIRVDLMPWVAEVAEPALAFEARAGIAFFGGFSHPPNLDAVLWFVENVLPTLTRKRPGIRFHIFGADVPPLLKHMHSESVVVEGFVDDPHEAYRQCRVFVAPLRFGAGIKAKVVGALASSVPVVASEVAAEGIVCESESGCRIARTVDDWVAEILTIYDSEHLWTLASSAARDLAARRFSRESGRQRLKRVLDGLMPESAV